MSGAPTFTPKALQRGVLARSVSDWFSENRYEASVDWTASAGNYRGIMLTTAQNVNIRTHVVAIRASVPAAAKVVIGHNTGFITSAPAESLPVFPAGGPATGVVRAFTAAQANFVEDLTLFNHTLSWDWNHEYAFQVVGPGSVLMIAALASDVSIAIGWLELNN